MAQQVERLVHPQKDGRTLDGPPCSPRRVDGPALTADASVKARLVFAAVRRSSFVFAFIGAIGSSWLGQADFRPSATDLQWPCRLQTGLRRWSSRAYAILNNRVAAGLRPSRGSAPSSTRSIVLPLAMRTCGA